MSGPKARGQRSRLVRWAVRAVHALVALVALALIVQMAALPSLVRSVAVGELRRAGLAEADLEVRSVGWWSAELANVTLDSGGRARVGSLDVLYSPASLLRARVRLIEVTGAEVEFRLRDGRLDLGPLADIKSTGAGGDSELPFGALAIRASSLVLDVEGRRVRVPIHGTVTALDGERCSLDLTADIEGLALRLKGTCDTSGEQAELTLAGETPDVGQLLTALRSKLPTLPEHAAGGLTLQADCKLSDGAGRVTFQASSERLDLPGAAGGAAVRLDEFHCDAEAQLSTSGELGGLRGQLRAAQASVGPHAAKAPRVTFARSEDGVGVTASAEGESWRLAKLEGRVRGVFDSASDVTCEASWAVEGTLTAAVLARLRAAGVVADGVGQVSVEGRATGVWPRAKANGEEPRDWSLALEEMRVAVAPGAVSCPPLGLEARDLAVDARFTGRLLPGQATVTLLSGSAVRAARIAVADPQVAGRFEVDDGPCAEIRVGEQGAALSASRENGRWSWRVDAPAVLAAASGGELALPQEGVNLTGVAAELRLAITAKPERLSGDVKGGSRLVVGSVTPAEETGVEVAPAADDRPVLALALGDEAAEWRVSLDEPGRPYRFRAPRLRAVLNETDVSLRDPAVQVAKLAGELAFGAKLKINEADLDIGKGSWLGAESASLDAGSQPIAIGPARLVLEEKDDALELVYSGFKKKWDLSVRAALAEPVEVTAGEGQRLRLKTLRGGVAAEHDVTGMALQAHVVSDGVHGVVMGQLGERELTGELKDGSLRVGLRGTFSGAKETVELAELPLQATLSLTCGQGGTLHLSQTGDDTREEMNAAAGTITAGCTATLLDSAFAFTGELAVDGIRTSVQRRGPEERLDGKWSDGSLRLSAKGQGKTSHLAGASVEATFSVATGEGGAQLAGGSAGKARIETASVTVQGQATVDGKRGPTLRATGTVKAGAASHEASALAMSDLTATIPIAWGVEPQKAGGFQIAGIRRGEDRFPPLSGTLRIVDQRAEVTACAVLLPGPDPGTPQEKNAQLEADGWVELRGGVPRGELHVTVPPFELDESNQPADRWGILQGTRAYGTFGLDGRIRLIGRYIAPDVTLTVQDARFESAELDAAAEGVNASITLNRFRPVGTPGAQRIEVAKANLGKLEVRDGLVQFRIERPDSILVEKTEWGWAGGRLYTYALRFDPTEPPIDLVVYGDKLHLGQMLALLPEDRAAGEGTLYGRLAVRIGQWPDIRFREGFIYATPGERGWVRFRDAEIVGIALERQDPRFRENPLYRQVKERIVGGLSDLEYSMFRADLVGRETALGDAALDLRIRLAGHGRTGAKQEFAGIEINIADFDEVLKSAILVHRRVQQRIE
jgi:hypothetical protein